ncbi:MAG: D-glycero-alpha-D-manno-heptose-1,7-bisphosphate 7-phosphatase [Phycisphaerae bacterium]
MSRPAVFFDRDNTLILNDGYLAEPDEVRLVDGAAEALARLRGLGFAIVVVSNQSGVARGLHTEEDVHRVNERMRDLLREADAAAEIDHIEYCPYHPEAVVEDYRRDSDLRKPRPGMLFRAAEELDLDLAASWMVGDAPRDMEAGRRAGCRCVLLMLPGITASPATQEVLEASPELVAGSLAEAADYIEANQARHQPSEEAVHPEPEEAAEPDDAAGHSRAYEERGEPIEIEVHPWPTPPPPPPQQPFVVPPPTATSVPTEVDLQPVTDEVRRLRQTVEAAMAEAKRQAESPQSEFSLGKLLGSVVQVLALGTLFMAFLYREDVGTLTALLLGAIFLQVLVATLFLLDRTPK